MEGKEEKAFAALGARLSTETPNGNSIPSAVAEHQKKFGAEDAQRHAEARESVPEDEAGTKAPVFNDDAAADEPATEEKKPTE